MSSMNTRSDPRRGVDMCDKSAVKMMEDSGSFGFEPSFSYQALSTHNNGRVCENDNISSKAQIVAHLRSSGSKTDYLST
jgi:hypothetical protein